MRFRLYAIIAFAAALSMAVAALTGAHIALIATSAAVMIAALGLCYRAVAKPLDAVYNGISLLKSQDFSSRLRKTGQHDADRVISMFNRMMDSMKAERLKNKEQYQFLRKLLDNSPMGVAICDFDGNVTEANPAYRLMITPQLQETIDRLLPGETQTVRQGNADIYRCTRQWFMDSGFRRPFVLVERMTAEIAQAERDVFRKIVRTIGHEVNNTVGPVVSVLDTLADINSDDPDVTAAIDSSRHSCLSLVNFVKRYADVVKLPAPSPVTVNLGDELERLMPTLQAVAGDRAHLVLTITDRHVGLQLDMTLIDRVLINIIKNAAESIGATPGGKIIISLDGSRLTVTDNGAGISPGDVSRLFTPFFSTKQPYRGLGLMLIADILRAHRAIFSLTTDPATSLTTFAIDFPTAISKPLR